MPGYVISCCSTADLSAEHFAARDIHYICFHFELDGKHYPDDLGNSVPFDQFYRAMENGAMTRTSQINVEEFVAYFTPFLEAGQDISHVSLSSGLSGVFSSASIARTELLERFPERKILLVDSLGASSGYGLLMDRLADLRDGGMEADALGRLGRSAQARAAPLVLFHGSQVLYPRRPDQQDRRLCRHAPGHLPAFEHGRPGASDSPP